MVGSIKMITLLKQRSSISEFNYIIELRQNSFKLAMMLVGLFLFITFTLFKRRREAGLTVKF
jgi:hypothetical protein